MAEEAQTPLDQLDDGARTMARTRLAARLVGLREAKASKRAQEPLDGWDPSQPAPGAEAVAMKCDGHDALSDLMDSAEAQKLADLNREHLATIAIDAEHARMSDDTTVRTHASASWHLTSCALMKFPSG